LKYIFVTQNLPDTHIPKLLPVDAEKEGSFVIWVPLHAELMIFLQVHSID